MSRTTVELRQALEDAAATSGRSLGQEVEARLERSFEIGPLAGAMMSDRWSMELFRALARVLVGVRRRAAKEGWSEIQTREALKAGFECVAEISFWTGGGVVSVLDAYKSPIAPDAPNPFPALEGENIAHDVMMYASAFDEYGLMEDFEETIRDVWSGSGSEKIDPRGPIERHLPKRARSDMSAEIEKHWVPGSPMPGARYSFGDGEKPALDRAERDMHRAHADLRQGDIRKSKSRSMKQRDKN